MAALTYQVQYIPDPVFWSQLSKLPLPNGEYPEMLTPGNRTKFAYVGRSFRAGHLGTTR